MRIIGIDPGTSRIGFSIIEKKEGKISYVASGLLPVKKGENTGALLFSIEKNIKKIINKYSPEVAGIEKLFWGNNKKTAFGVAETRGIIMKTLFEYKIPFTELSPTEVKLFIGGSGKSYKKDLARMAGRFIKKDISKKIDDETDAIAIGIVIAITSR